MKTVFVVLFIAVYSVECGRKYVPINKNANIDFINMEGGGVRPANIPAQKAPANLPAQKTPVQAPAPITPPANTPPKPVAPSSPTPKLVPIQPTVQPMKPIQPQPVTVKPIQPKPVNPTPAARPITTPGPGTVKQLVNFYDSQGKASVIRPYSYSQAVKQG